MSISTTVHVNNCIVNVDFHIEDEGCLYIEEVRATDSDENIFDLLSEKLIKEIEQIVLGDLDKIITNHVSEMRADALI